ncbi:MAG: hypothetical protein DRJ66_07815 [Thermoprotei archaeon]|nr:MAG: hypothetical protein DRJ66_07815 [Thermoprotei archaeon]RLF19138.1 MAG: hypothetical protein DRZ82_06680 [Thermoprotei archaeon]
MYTYKVKVLSGYRITIPKEVRERWSLEIGDEIEITVEGSKLTLRPVKLMRDPVLGMLGIIGEKEIELKEPEKAVIAELEEKLRRS